MTYRVIKVAHRSADRFTVAFAWILVAAVGFWVIAIALLLWGVTR